MKYRLKENKTEVMMCSRKPQEFRIKIDENTVKREIYNRYMES